MLLGLLTTPFASAQYNPGHTYLWSFLKLVRHVSLRKVRPVSGIPMARWRVISRAYRNHGISEVIIKSEAMVTLSDGRVYRVSPPCARKLSDLSLGVVMRNIILKSRRVYSFDKIAYSSYSLFYLETLVCYSVSAGFLILYRI